MSRMLTSTRRFDEHSFDLPLLLVVVVLLTFGVIMVFSAGISTGSENLQLQTSHLYRHLAHVGLGVVLMLMMRQIKLAWLQKASLVLLLFGVLMLLVLFIPGVGHKVNGAVRWFDIGFRVQPAELMKVIVLVYMADYYARKYQSVHVFKVGILNIGLVLIFIAALLLLQPDFGTTVVIMATCAGMMFIAGVRISWFVAAVLLAAIALALLAWFSPYRLERLTTYQDPWATPFAQGFQLTQALMAIGRGGWLGVGLGNSLQKLDYLPHADNDFLVAIIGEELGAVGIIVVMLLFFTLIWRAFVISARALMVGQRFSGFLASGVGLLLIVNTGIHIGVNTGMLPTKGLTLPLMSSGGSSMIASLVAIGLLLAVDRETRAKPRDRREPISRNGEGLYA